MLVDIKLKSPRKITVHILECKKSFINTKNILYWGDWNMCSFPYPCVDSFPSGVCNALLEAKNMIKI